MIAFLIKLRWRDFVKNRKIKGVLSGLIFSMAGLLMPAVAFSVGIATPILGSFTVENKDKTDDFSLDVKQSGFYLTGSNKGMVGTGGIGYITQEWSDSSNSFEFSGVDAFVAIPVPVHRSRKVGVWLGPKFGFSLLSGSNSGTDSFGELVTTDSTVTSIYMRGSAGLQYQIQPGLHISAQVDLPLADLTTSSVDKKTSQSGFVLSDSTPDQDMSTSGMVFYIGISYDGSAKSEEW